MKFKVGDKVKVIATLHKQACNVGDIVTIKKADVCDSSYLCDIYDVYDAWFYENELGAIENGENNIFTISDLKDGDKCTLKNGQVIFVDKTSDYGFSNINKQLKYFNDDVSIVKVERPVKYETMFERKEEILDEVEKKYLADVVRPFRSKVRSVYKMASICSNKEFINIQLRDENFTLPYFEKGTMYKEMQTGKRYTLEKLGL